MTKCFGKRSAIVLLFVLIAWPTSPAPVLADGTGLREIELHGINNAEKVTWARAAKVSIIDAIRTATAQTPGQVIQATLESLNGRLLYEIEVVTGDGKVFELFVDPQTGNLIDAGGKE